jgi:hypothetical protein
MTDGRTLRVHILAEFNRKRSWSQYLDIMGRVRQVWGDEWMIMAACALYDAKITWVGTTTSLRLEMQVPPQFGLTPHRHLFLGHYFEKHWISLIMPDAAQAQAWAAAGRLRPGAAVTTMCFCTAALTAPNLVLGRSNGSFEVACVHSYFAAAVRRITLRAGVRLRRRRRPAPRSPASE